MNLPLLRPFRMLPVLAISVVFVLPACSDAPAATTPAATTVSGTKIKADEATAVAPRPGKWLALISNGFKGDTLTFTVSANGKQVENMAFKGHWRNRSRYPEVLMHLDPPQPFAIAKDSFGAVQREPDAAMWWEVSGRFTSSTSAEGSYRATFAGGDNDTYKLLWTARHIGK